MNQQSPPNNLSAIVLAAGKSQRTSPENKLLLPFHNKTIIETVLDEIVSLDFAEILVVTGFEESKIQEALQAYPVRFVSNPDYIQGMATSIKAGILKAKSDADGYMIFLGDMPWIDNEVLKRQIQSFYDSPKSAIVVPTFQKRRGNPVIFAQKYRNELFNLTGDSGARFIIEKYDDQVIDLTLDKENPLRDVDSWDDYDDLE